MLPPGIKAERVYARNEAFDKYAAGGHWLVDYNGPPLGPGYFTIRYMTDEIRKAAQEYSDAKYSGIFCRGRNIAPVDVMGHWKRRSAITSIRVLAEWTWNVKGRDPRHFAEAWATMNRVAPPDQFAAWIEMIRSPESLVRTWEYAPTVNWLNGTDEIGGILTSSLPRPENIRQMLAKCDQAMPLAEGISDESVLLETRYLRTFLQAMLGFRDLADRSAARDASVAERTKERQEDAARIAASLEELGQLCEALLKTPAVDPKFGPEQKKARYDDWTRELSKCVEALAGAVGTQTLQKSGRTVGVSLTSWHIFFAPFFFFVASASLRLRRAPSSIRLSFVWARHKICQPGGQSLRGR